MKGDEQRHIDTTPQLKWHTSRLDTMSSKPWTLYLPGICIHKESGITTKTTSAIEERTTGNQISPSADKDLAQEPLHVDAERKWNKPFVFRPISLPPETHPLLLPQDNKTSWTRRPTTFQDNGLSLPPRHAHSVSDSSATIGAYSRLSVGSTAVSQFSRNVTWNTAYSRHNSNNEQQAFENTSTSVAASQMRNALNNLADTVTDPEDKKVC